MESTTEFVNMNTWIGFDEVFIAAVTTLDNMATEPFTLVETSYKTDEHYSIKMLRKNGEVMNLLYNCDPIISRENILDKTINEEGNHKIYSHAVRLDILLPNFTKQRCKTNSMLSIEASPFVTEKYLKYLKMIDLPMDGEKCQESNPTKKLTFPKINKK